MRCESYLLLHVVNNTLAPIVVVLAVLLLVISEDGHGRGMLYIPRARNGNPDLHGILSGPSSLTALVVSPCAVIMGKGAVRCHKVVREVLSDVAWHVSLPGAGRIVRGRELERVFFVDFEAWGVHID